jgi:outer membrane protein
VDTLLSVQPVAIDEPTLAKEATKNRPDLMAVEAELAAARGGVTSARFARLPYLTVSGSAAFHSTSSSKFEQPDTDPLTGEEIAGTRSTNNTQSKTDHSIGGTVALNWAFFDGLATDSRMASARARLLRAQNSRDALRRNLDSEVHQAVLTYRVAVEQERVAQDGLESAAENLKLTQEKYNVGSATILDLIDAQVQLQRAQSDVVSALAAIRVAEAQLNRVRGRAE